ncbi:MAG: phospholipase D-like domain-containing protein [Phenylobacterium sp.]|uniref:phospholipase D-like domain-containing protein n=1 Tax=Phenylobacterium sp. TaxID=1871053 RepID=UPI00391CF51E
MSVLQPGETCWRRVRAERAAFLIDTEAYFTAVYEALHRARKSIILLGWGFDPRARLFPDGHDGPNDPDEVGRILVQIAQARPEIDIRLLIWKSALPVAAVQEFFPHRARRWFRGTGVRFRLDDSVPFGACHHQKVLVIDDELAFCGGGDIGVDRWDTAAHLDEDLRRIMPRQSCHDPRHEVMIMVDGEAARSLGEMARERWRHATGETIAPPAHDGGLDDPWPPHIPAHLTGPPVSIQRTAPAWKGARPVSEIRRLDLASIAAAKTAIYLENQYFTSPAVAEALARRLAEPEGPEVVLISTGRSPSWFDQATMDRARANMLWRLKAADVFGRFRAWHPVTPGGKTIIVHSKVTVIDDALARVGSSNLNNRSGGFDTEAEVAVEAQSDDHRLAIAAFRNRLIGHFVGATGETVAKAWAERGSLIDAIESLNADGRLVEIRPMKQSALGEFIAAYHIGDPADVEDSWRPLRRRERLYAALREAPRLSRSG